MESVETYKFKDGAVLEIFQDEDLSNPRTEFDNATKMVCFHKRYDLGDKQDDYNSKDFGCWEELRQAIEQNEKVAIILPLRMYDHSGISISLSHSGQYVDYWDSGQAGFVYITEETLQKEWGGDKEKALSCLQAEVHEYDLYLRGEVYGFVLSKPPVKCEYCQQEQVDTEDSCWGFYGDIKENGMLESIPEKYRKELSDMI